MSAMLNPLNNNFVISCLILIKLVSVFTVCKAHRREMYFILGLHSPLSTMRSRTTVYMAKRSLHQGVKESKTRGTYC